MHLHKEACPQIESVKAAAETRFKTQLNIASTLAKQEGYATLENGLFSKEASARIEPALCAKQGSFQQVQYAF